MVRVLHTADWHLGRTLHGQRRLSESAQFLEWLLATIREESVEVLLVAGDIFDSVAPGTRALELYHRFLADLWKSDCQHVVIVGGNHDSPSVLESSAAVLEHLDVHVVGAARENPADEILLLDDADGIPMLIVAAVPFLRDQDIRLSRENESLADKDRRLLDGITGHYRSVAEAAVTLRETLNRPLPIIGMGHLFVTGGRLQIETGEGVRDLYVGSLGQVSVDVFPTEFDYVALGHLHIPHQVDQRNNIRYSGSPLPMGFGEAAQEKLVYLVDIDENQLDVTSRTVPRFQELEQIRGNWDDIQTRLMELIAISSEAWLEIVYTGIELIPDLQSRAEAIIASSDLKILKVMNLVFRNLTLEGDQISERLEDLRPEDVFQRQMTLKNVPISQQTELMEAFREILFGLENVEADA